jgi:hypothetical protein
MKQLHLHIIVITLILTFSNGSFAQGTADQNPFLRGKLLMKLGKTKPLSWFAFKARQPLSWKTDPMAQSGDPGYLKRLMVENGAVQTQYMYGKKQYFKYKISLELLLKKPQIPTNALNRWMKSTLKNRLLSSPYNRWPIKWQSNQVKKIALPGNRTLIVRIMVGGSRPSRYVKPLAIQLVGAMVIDGKHATILGTGLASDNEFNLLTNTQKQVAMKGFVHTYEQMMMVAALGKIKLPGRDRSMERKLKLKKKFIHASKSSLSIGTMTKSSISSHRVLHIKFKGNKLTMRNDFSSLYSHSKSSIFDEPGTDPLVTNAAGGGKKYTPWSKYEVRKSGKNRWLVVYMKTGTTFYTINSSKKRKCSKKTIKGIAIDGMVEGVYSTFRGWCVYTPPSKAKF